MLSEWWTFSDGMVGIDLNAPGVYEFANTADAVVYIGSTNDIKRRLNEHLGESTTSCIKKNAAKYRIEYTTNYVAHERELIDGYMRTYGKLPQCNTVRP